MADNPFPAVMGRVCYHPCQTACNRGQLDEAVGINSVERFLGDLALSRAGRCRVRAGQPGGACWSSAPARAAWPRRTTCGCSGTTSRSRDAGAAPGGMMRYGIPRYRLPREVLDAEIDRILALGVRLELGRRGDRTSKPR